MTRKAIPAECRQKKSLIPERLGIDVRVPTNASDQRLPTGRRGGGRGQAPLSCPPGRGESPGGGSGLTSWGRCRGGWGQGCGGRGFWGCLDEWGWVGGAEGQAFRHSVWG